MHSAKKVITMATVTKVKGGGGWCGSGTSSAAIRVCVIIFLVLSHLVVLCHANGILCGVFGLVCHFLRGCSPHLSPISYFPFSLKTARARTGNQDYFNIRFSRGNLFE